MPRRSQLSTGGSGALNALCGCTCREEDGREQHTAAGGHGGVHAQSRCPAAPPNAARVDCSAFGTRKEWTTKPGIVSLAPTTPKCIFETDQRALVRFGGSTVLLIAPTPAPSCIRPRPRPRPPPFPVHRNGHPLTRRRRGRVGPGPPPPDLAPPPATLQPTPTAAGAATETPLGRVPPGTPRGNRSKRQCLWLATGRPLTPPLSPPPPPSWCTGLETGGPPPPPPSHRDTLTIWQPKGSGVPPASTRASPPSSPPHQPPPARRRGTPPPPAHRTGAASAGLVGPRRGRPAPSPPAPTPPFRRLHPPGGVGGARPCHSRHGTGRQRRGAPAGGARAS